MDAIGRAVAAVTSADIDRARELLVMLSRRAYTFGLTLGVSGNLSMRIPGQPRIVIKATGKSMGDMTAADTLVLDLDGNVVEDGTALRPSKERWFHVAIYRGRPDVGAVVHLHPPHAVAFAALHETPPALTGAARAFVGKIALVPPAPSGSRELAEMVGEAFRDPAIHAAILAEHGTVTVGPDLYQAFYLTQYLEDAARTACLVRQLRGGGA